MSWFFLSDPALFSFASRPPFWLHFRRWPFYISFCSAQNVIPSSAADRIMCSCLAAFSPPYPPGHPSQDVSPAFLSSPAATLSVPIVSFVCSETTSYPSLSYLPLLKSCVPSGAAVLYGLFPLTHSGLFPAGLGMWKFYLAACLPLWFSLLCNGFLQSLPRVSARSSQGVST